MHQGISSCPNSYVGETMKKAATGIDEDEQPNGKLGIF